MRRAGGSIRSIKGALSSVGQSGRLIIFWSQVQVLQGPFLDYRLETVGKGQQAVGWGESPGLVPGMVRLVVLLVELRSLKHTGASPVDGVRAGGESPGLDPGMVRLVVLLVELRSLKHTGASPVDGQPSSRSHAKTRRRNGCFWSDGLVPSWIDHEPRTTNQQLPPPGGQNSFDFKGGGA